MTASLTLRTGVEITRLTHCLKPQLAKLGSEQSA